MTIDPNTTSQTNKLSHLQTDKLSLSKKFHEQNIVTGGLHKIEHFNQFFHIVLSLKTKKNSKQKFPIKIHKIIQFTRDQISLFY